MDDYLVHYGELREVCEVTIGAWEQFGPGYDADAVDAVAAAGPRKVSSCQRVIMS